MLLAIGGGARASSLWQINEIYSNADGSVQFIELITASGGQQFVTGQAMTSSQRAATYTLNITTDLPGDSANKTFLIGTQGFAALNIVAQDYVVPNGFLFTNGGTLNWGSGADIVSYASLPTDGKLSINRAGATAINSPTNFAGATGSIRRMRSDFDGDGKDDILWRNSATGDNDLSLSVTTPALAPLPLVLWSASLKTGDLGEWSEKVNSGSADTTVVSAASVGIPPRDSSYVMMQAVTGAEGGTRMQRYPEVDFLARTGTTFYWSWWDYFPTPITFGIFDTFILFGINSRVSSDSAGDPFWSLVFHDTGNTLDLVWSPNQAAPAEGPHAGESGRQRYNSSTPVPVGQWVFFEVMITPRGDFTGALKIWMNGQVLFDQSLVKTMYPNVGQTSVILWLEQTGYGSRLTPTPAVHYVDDVTVSLARMPNAP